MFTNKKFLTFSVAGIAFLVSMIATASPVQAEQSGARNKADQRYTIGQIERYHRTNRPPWRNPDYTFRNNRRAQMWERARMQRYRQCLVHSRRSWRCEHILREANPFREHHNPFREHHWD